MNENIPFVVCTSSLLVLSRFAFGPCHKRSHHIITSSHQCAFSLVIRCIPFCPINLSQIVFVTSCFVDFAASPARSLSPVVLSGRGSCVGSTSPPIDCFRCAFLISNVCYLAIHQLSFPHSHRNCCPLAASRFTQKSRDYIQNDEMNRDTRKNTLVFAYATNTRSGRGKSRDRRIYAPTNSVRM